MPSEEPLSTATTPRRGWVCAASDSRHPRSQATASRVTSTTSTLGERTSSDGGRSIDGCRGHEGALRRRASLARRSCRTQEGGRCPPSETCGDPTATASSRSASSPALRAAVFLAAVFFAVALLACGLPARSSSWPPACARRSSCALSPSSPSPCARRRLPGRGLPPSRSSFLAVDLRRLGGGGLPLARAFLAAAFLLAVVFLAAVLRFAVDSLLRGRHRSPPFLGLRTPCASGVAVPVRSSLPTRRTARRGEGRSSGTRCEPGQSAQIRLASLDEPPFSGKKTSGSCSPHRARSCHGM